MAKYFTNLLAVSHIPVHKKIARWAVVFVVDGWGLPRTARKSRRLWGIRSRMPLAYCTRILLKCSLTHCQTPRGGFRPTSPYTKKIARWAIVFVVDVEGLKPPTLSV